MSTFRVTVTLEYADENYPEKLTEEFVQDLAIEDISRNNFELEVEEVDE